MTTAPSRPAPTRRASPCYYVQVRTQAAMVTMDYSGARCKALVGGLGEKTTDLGLNRAVDSDTRQSGGGSTMKPIGGLLAWALTTASATSPPSWRTPRFCTQGGPEGAGCGLLPPARLLQHRTSTTRPPGAGRPRTSGSDWPIQLDKRTPRRTALQCHSWPTAHGPVLATPCAVRVGQLGGGGQHVQLRPRHPAHGQPHRPPTPTTPPSCWGSQSDGRDAWWSCAPPIRCSVTAASTPRPTCTPMVENAATGEVISGQHRRRSPPPRPSSPRHRHDHEPAAATGVLATRRYRRHRHRGQRRRRDGGRGQDRHHHRQQRLHLSWA